MNNNNHIEISLTDLINFFYEILFYNKHLTENIKYIIW